MAAAHRANGDSPGERPQERLAEDLKVVAQDIEELIKAAGAEMSDKTRELREHLNRAMELAYAGVQELQDEAVAQVRAADTIVRRNPYQFIGIAFGAGLLLGLSFPRR